MTVEQVYLVAQIIAALAVVASLIFVGFQPRHNAEQQRLSALVGYYEIYRDITSPVMNDSGIADMIVRGLKAAKTS